MAKATNQGHSYIVHIRQCQLPFCDTWYIGPPRSRWCEKHRGEIGNWLKPNSPPKGKDSIFTKEMLKELREMFLTHSPQEVADHFGISRSTVYRYYHKTPKNLRQV